MECTIDRHRLRAADLRESNALYTQVRETLPPPYRLDGEEVATEGCLSIPGIVADVPRAQRLTLKGKNRRGRGITLEAEGLLARVIQHEVDHLDGVLFLDRVVDRSTIREAAATTEVEPSGGSDRAHPGEPAEPTPAGG